MGAALLLDEADVLLGQEDVLGDSEYLSKNENVLDGVVRRLRRKGHDAVGVCERGSPKNTLKYLKSWRDETGYKE